LRYILFIFTLLLIGCNKTTYQKESDKSTETNKIISTNSKPKIKKEIKIIKKFPNLVFKEKNETIFYETNTTNILLFVDNSNLSIAQKEELNKSKIDFYIIKNIKLLNYFDIKKFPTLIILEKNKTKKYEGFIPSEVLKYELKD